MPAEYVVAITGASGAPYAVALLRALRERGATTHLILSPTARAVVPFETGLQLDEVLALADRHHDPADLFSPLASGSYAWRLAGMAIVPCSMKTLAAVAHGYADNLIARAADVMLKERRPLVLMPRETPLSLLHLRNLVTVAEAGAVVVPPMPAFYSRPRTLDDIVYQTVQRLLVHLGLPADPDSGWQGLPVAADD